MSVCVCGIVSHYIFSFLWMSHWKNTISLINCWAGEKPGALCIVDPSVKQSLKHYHSYTHTMSLISLLISCSLDPIGTVKVRYLRKVKQLHVNLLNLDMINVSKISGVRD